jgi:hypothetical protein
MEKTSMRLSAIVDYGSFIDNDESMAQNIQMLMSPFNQEQYKIGVAKHRGNYIDILNEMHQPSQAPTTLLGNDTF